MREPEDLRTRVGRERIGRRMLKRKMEVRMKNERDRCWLFLPSTGVNGQMSMRSVTAVTHVTGRIASAPC